MMKKIAVFVLCLLILSSSAFAADMSAWNKDSSSYGQKAFHKFTYGLSNVVLGWSEIFTEPYEAAKSGDNFIEGVGRGLWNGIADTVGGALHLVTFPLTTVDIPLPEGGIVLACCK